MIIDISIWTENTNIRHGENEMKRICKRFLLNEQNAINGLRQLTDDNTLLPKKSRPKSIICVKHFQYQQLSVKEGLV